MADLRRYLAALLALTATASLSACGDERKPAYAEPAPSSAGSSPVPESATTSAATPAQVTVTPAAGRTGVPVSTEIGLKASGGEVTAVTLADTKGKTVPGDFRADGSAWVPRTPLKNSQKYEASVVATAADGRTTTVKTSFTTMAAGGRKTGTGLYLFDGRTYGVAMPVVVEFNPGIKKADRAAVENRMFVRTEPAQPGRWSWTPTGTQAYYRAPDYWKPGTKLSVRIAVGGLPTGGGRYGDRDRSATATIGRKFEMKVDNGTKQMTVLENDQVVKTMPVSLGKKSTPSSSGTMVVMQKMADTIFDTTDTDGAAGYRQPIQYAQRLTWSGQYIHSAPWSTGDQGHRNVSHGCVNISPSNARWLFGKTEIGDPVTVRGTEDKLSYGNGWTPWDVSWEKYVEGSALEVPAALR